jgi:hypothetical protein
MWMHGSILDHLDREFLEEYIEILRYLRTQVIICPHHTITYDSAPKCLTITIFVKQGVPESSLALRVCELHFSERLAQL